MQKPMTAKAPPPKQKVVPIVEETQLKPLVAIDSSVLVESEEFTIKSIEREVTLACSIGTAWYTKI